MNLKDVMPSLGPIIRDTSATSVAIIIYGTPVKNKICYGAIRVRHDNNHPWILNILELKDNCYYSERFVFENLLPNTIYQYQYLTINVDSTDELEFIDWCQAEESTFKTDDPQRNNYEFAFGSCRYFIQIGSLYALGNQISDKAFQTINKMIDQGENIEMLLQIGDQVYTDTINLFPWLRLTSMNSLLALHKNARISSGLKQLMSRIETKCIEDDHAYRDNGTPELGAQEPQVYQNCIDCVNIFDHPNGPLPYGSELKYGISFERGPFKFFLCDSRFERNGNKIMSDEQWYRLENWLISDPDKIKFLISPAPVFCQRYDDTWYGFPEDQERLVSLVYRYKINNLVILSGDAHSSLLAEYRIYRNNKMTDLKITEILSSPFYAIFHDSPSNFYNELNLTHVGSRKYSLLTDESKAELRKRVLNQDNFATVKSDHQDQSIQVDYYSKDGQLLSNYLIKFK